MQEVLDCVVSPEWALALSGAGHIQASSLARTDLWQEALLLEKLLYKNSNQHHGSLHYQRLLEVRRLLRLLKGLQVERRAQGLQAALQAARQPGALPTGVLLAYGGDQRRVPSHAAAAGVLAALRAACRVAEQLAPAVHRASLHLLAQLAHSFFMPLCLTALAALARIQVLSGQLMLDAVKAYNSLAEAAALLPLAPDASGTPAVAEAAVEAEAASAAAAAAALSQLPQLLRAQWRDGLPRLDCIPCQPGDSLAEQAATACARYSLHLVQPAAAAVEAGGLAGDGAAAARRQRKPTILGVVEDRGVPISRDAFMADAEAAAASAEEGEVLPPAPGVGAAADAGAAAAAAAGGPAALLGVLEDAVPGAATAATAAAFGVQLAQAQQQPAAVQQVQRRQIVAGTVVSKMEGEERAVRYRRSTMGVLGQLGRRPLGGLDLVPVSLPPTQWQQPAAAATEAAAVADLGEEREAAPPAAAAAAEAAAAGGTAVEAAAAAAAVPPPAAMQSVAAPVAATAAAASVAPRPSFVRVDFSSAAASAAQPAFVAVAAPPAPDAFLPAALRPEPPAPAAALPAPPLLLDASSGRKRKKLAANAAAAAAAAQQPPAAPEPAAAKSWEDWLQPLGEGGTPGGSAAGPLPPPRQQQQQGKRRRGT